MDFGKYGNLIRDYVYSSYSNVFEFDIKKAYNGGDTIKVIVTFKTSYKDDYPMKLKFEINKDTLDFNINKIYENFVEKLVGLEREGRFANFFKYRDDTDIDDDDVSIFIKDNKDILGEEIEAETKNKIKEILMIIKKRKK